MNRDALVVGINQYPFLKDSPTSKAKHLNTPASDAEAIALRLEEYGGFRVRRLPESIQEEQRGVDPKKLVQGDALYEAIIQLFNPVGDSIPQTALLYFAGHGLRRNLGGVTEGFLATSDSDPRKNQWGVSLRWLRELLQKSQVHQQMVWLDCCYSGELLNFAEADFGTAGQGRTRFFIAAAREFEPAEEDIQGQHGVFSQVLCEGLDPRRQPEGVVNNDRLIEYIDQRLKGTPQQPIWYNPNCEILLTGEREEVFVSTPDGVCPYKGLRFFDVEDAPYFYGRKALTQKLIERVQVGKGNFLAVLGVSGSGKSSVLRAGLMYQLQQERRLPGTEQWKIRIFTPGEQPLVSLATAFLDEEVTDIERAGQLKAAEEAIAQGATGLARLIRVSKSPRTVLIVDQFEEVFTVCQSQAERQQFISSLLGALKQTGDKLCLIFAMRDDFLGKCAAYQEMADLIQANLVMVTPMNAQELRQAIIEPAKKLGRKVEENLINAILKDLGVEVEQQTREPEPGMLPLLSYTLEQLWQRQTLSWLKLDSYNQLGGVEKTLENLAEQAYKELSTEEQRVADQIFIKLTQLGEGTPDTRKRVPQQDLVPQPQSTGLVEQVIQKLAHAKLIVTSEQRKGQEQVAVVDVAHEALIRHWSRLRKLLENNREAIRTERKIQTVAEEWRTQVCSLSFSPDNQTFAITAGEVEGCTIQLWSCKGKLLKRIPLKNLDIKDFYHSIIFSPDGSTVTFRFEDKIYFWKWDKDQEKPHIFKDGGSPISISPDGKTFALAHLAGTISFWRWEGEKHHTFRGLPKLHHHGFSPDGQAIAACVNLRCVSFSPDGQAIAATGTTSTVKIWSREGIELRSISTDCDWVSIVKFSSDGEMIATAGFSFDCSPDEKLRGTNRYLVQLWQGDGTLLKTFEESGTGVSFSPNRQIIAVATNPINPVVTQGYCPVQLWRRDGTLLNTIQGHRHPIFHISFSPDGQVIATACDEMVKLWNLEGEELHTLKGDQTFRSEGNFVSFSPDGETIATTSDYAVKLWNRQGEELRRLRGHKAQVNSVIFNPNGHMIATASSDGTVKLWSREGKELHTLRDDEPNGHVSSISFSPDGKWLASGKLDGTVKLWNLDFDDLMQRGCNWLRGYLKTNPNLSESERHLCDGIGTAN